MTGGRANHMFTAPCLSGADYMKEDYTALLQRPPPDVTLNILRALRSDRWQEPPPGSPCLPVSQHPGPLAGQALQALMLALALPNL